MEEGKEMVIPYIFTTKFGVAIVNASSLDEAIALLRKKEGDERYMTYDESALKIKPLSKEKGVIYYRPE